MIYTKDDLLRRTKKHGECLVWQGAKAGKGYGVVADDRERYVHRLMLMLDHRAPSKEQQAAHRCGQSDCINPDHLYVATQAENEADKIAHGTYLHGRPGESHCGKYLDPEMRQKSKRCKKSAQHSGPCKEDVFEQSYERVYVPENRKAEKCV